MKAIKDIGTIFEGTFDCPIVKREVLLRVAVFSATKSNGNKIREKVIDCNHSPCSLVEFPPSSFNHCAYCKRTI